MELTLNTAGQIAFIEICDQHNKLTYQTILSCENGLDDGEMTTYTLTRCTICEGKACREHFDNRASEIMRFEEEKDIPGQQLWPRPSTFSSDHLVISAFA